MRVIDLCGEWEGECIRPDGSSFAFRGSVPGSAINDLINAKRLPQDIFWRDNATAVSEFENCDYVYKREFDFDVEGERIALRFERIDTYADVFLNGKKIYHSENGNIAHETDVTEIIEAGRNLIEVRLYSPSEWVKALPLRNGAFTTERLNTRRMQCTYGWDWVARFLTCGLGGCCLCVEEELEVRHENLYIATLDADAESASVRVDIEFPYEYEGRVFELTVTDPDGSVVCRKEQYFEESLLRAYLDVPCPRLWYPLGYGEQPLYTLRVSAEGRTLLSERFGIRTVKIMQLVDPEGSKNHSLCLSLKNPRYDLNTEFSGFVLKINGKRIFARGANWVPSVPFCCGNVDARVTEILELCAEAGVNMLRVWGGGAFESRHFYSECSRLGITVTQDFLMACGDYPEEQSRFIDELRKEAYYAARLCRNQPCLVWWSGDNENAVNGCDTDKDYNGRRSAYLGIAPVLYREDPARRFLPSSPYGGNRYASNTVGTTHNTQFLGQMFPYLRGEDLSDYKEEFKKYRARFIAEEPQLGAVSLPSLRRFMSEEEIFSESEMWYFHTKDNPALNFRLFDCLSNVAERILGSFTDGRDRLFKLQYIQYEWVRVVMEQARRDGDFCSGIIFWMMNDCWPAASGWALIDYYNLPKNAYWSFKRAAKETILSIDSEDGVYNLYAVNDGEAKTVRISLKVLSADGKNIREIVNKDLQIPEKSSGILLSVSEVLGENETLICDAVGDGACDRAFFRHGALRISADGICASVDRERRLIHLSAGDKYLHALVISGNVIPEDNCFSLLPGESRTVSYRPLSSDSEESITVEAYSLTV